MGTLQQEKAELIKLIEQLDADQLEAVRTALADTTPESEKAKSITQDSKGREFVACPMADCNRWMRKGRKPTVHYQAAHPGIEVPETV